MDSGELTPCRWLGSRLRRACSVLALLTFCMAFSGCTSYSAEAIEATVVDSETKEPLADAQILALWIAQGGFNYGSTVAFVQVLETKTDATGRFHLEAWGPRTIIRGRVRLQAPILLLFKRGYDLGAYINEGPIGTDAPPALTSSWNRRHLLMRRLSPSSVNTAASSSLFSSILLDLVDQGELPHAKSFVCAVMADTSTPRVAIESTHWLRAHGITCLQ
jgi:hypothetical protein